MARVRALDERRDGALRLRLARVRARVEAAAAHRVFAAERGRLRVLAQRTDELAPALRDGAAARASSAAGPTSGGCASGSRPSASTASSPRAASGSSASATGWRCCSAPRPRGGAPGSAGSRPRSTASRRSRCSGAATRSSFRRRSERLVRDAAEVEVGEALRIRLHKGALRATIVSKETE